jgi:hypothetical protein
MSRMSFAGYRVPIPGHPLLRIALGVILIVCGLLGFLPVLGFWMIPLGFAVLAIDFPPVRRFYRTATVHFGSWLHRKWPKAAKWFGYGKPRNGKH